MYTSSIVVGADLGLRTYDNLCIDSKASRCADGYFPVAMMCSEKRGLSDLPELLSAKTGTIVYGPNGKSIGTLLTIASSGATLASSVKDAGIKVIGDLFWSGCTKGGAYDTTVNLACSNWSTKSSTVEGVCGKFFFLNSSYLLVFVINKIF